MEIEKALENLSLEEKEIFDRIFAIRKEQIILKDLPEKYKEFERQELIYIKDKILNKEAVFNIKRNRRPQPFKAEIERTIDIEPDPFCSYQTETPIDELDRIENEASVTASNLSKMADYHSLVIFKKHNFFEINEKDFVSALNLAKEWFKKIKNFDQEIKTQIFIWNYHYRSGASILHPHFQLLAYKDMPLNVERLNSRLNFYQEKFDRNYFEDYFLLAKKLNLGKEKNNFKIWFSLTPEKEKALNFYGDLFSAGDFFYQILQKLIQTGTQSFNIFYVLDLNYGFFVDRGEINKKNSDLGALEIFGIKIISTDPFEFSKLVWD
ncbi:MAG: hypothetical protein KatS3mg096_310 [Candidatus Parcubacteria bacterium]|nr:MAG: hypothetical protein KatS3mg096_310 [Candidatus Parcubacteria bacterium]